MHILEYFPNRIRQAIYNCLNSDEEKCLEEIRIRVQRPIILKIGNQKKDVNYQITTQDVLTIMEKITENSLYSYQKQICEGFITLRGGHRVGISGNIIMEHDKVININYVYSLNFRLAKQVLGVSDKIIKEVIDHEKINNILIISPPGAGKTTLLRDLIRNISTSKTVGVVDERGEIAAMYKNEPQNDIGLNVDILSNVSKAIGMKMLVRSMSPEIICADEIGTKEDVEAIKYAVTSGVNGIFTAHGDSINSIKQSPILKELMELHLIDKVIMLEKNNRDHIKIENCNLYETLNYHQTIFEDIFSKSRPPR